MSLLSHLLLVLLIVVVVVVMTVVEYSSATLLCFSLTSLLSGVIQARNFMPVCGLVSLAV